ncbi:hypothetical protein B0H34DRAFT_645504 [Crassisporium funariophilum]|nr:hypothetical protein B0H34DRAFT_645504 [Crassisporium funariophilum]
MLYFDFFHGQLSATRARPLRAFLPALGLDFHAAPRTIQHDTPFHSMISTTTSVLASSTTSRYRTTANTPAIQQMPLELVLSFMEAACSSADNQAHIHLLKSCSLVCRAWSAAAQKLLFAQVTLCTQRSFELFMSAVDRNTDHGRILGNAVKRLRVVLDHNQPSSLHQHSFALAATVCPNLSELNISLYGSPEPGKDIVGVPDMSRLRRPAPSFDEHTLCLLKSGPTIKALHFNNWSENQHSIFQLLDVWPSLHFLSIGGTAPLPLQDSVPPFPSALQEVRFNFQSAPSIEFMHWLLHNSVNSLHTLRFEREPGLDLFEYLMNEHGSQLQSISLPVLGSLEHALTLQKCPLLRELRTETAASGSPLFYKQLPSALEHFAFGLDRDTPLNSIIEMVKSKNSLTALTIQCWEGGNHNASLSPLRIACAYRGVDLKMTNDLQSFRTTYSELNIKTIHLRYRREHVDIAILGGLQPRSRFYGRLDDDLDRHVAELIVREAKKKAERYGQQGIRAYISNNLSDGNVPRTNKRFLSSIIKSTDDHNKTILRAQAAAAQEVKRERDEQERRERRARAAEATEAERLRRSGRSSKRKRVSDDEGWDRWDGRTADRKRPARNWEEWNGGDGEEEDRDRTRTRRRNRSRSRSRERTTEKSSRSRRTILADENAPSLKRHRDSQTPPSRRQHSPDGSHKRHEDDSRRRRRRRSRDHSQRRHHRSSSCSHSPSPRSSSPSLRTTEKSGDRKRKRSRSPRYALDDIRDDPPSRQSPSTTFNYRKGEVVPTPPPTKTDIDLSKIDAYSPASSKRHSSHFRPLSRSPSPCAEPPIQLPSKMDRYFEDSYDPRLDVAPLQAPKVPATGLIDNAEFEGWDAMLELIRIRREDKGERKRMERLGLTKEKVKVKKTGIPSSSSAAVADRWGSEGDSIMDIEYKKKGSVREWDLGKEGF